MPLGTKHHETGLLLYEERWLTLQLEGGGRWRLDAKRNAHKLVGQRVRLTGIRDGFDLLYVKSIETI